MFACVSDATGRGASWTVAALVKLCGPGGVPWNICGTPATRTTMTRQATSSHCTTQTASKHGNIYNIYTFELEPKRVGIFENKNKIETKYSKQEKGNGSHNLTHLHDGAPGNEVVDVLGPPVHRQRSRLQAVVHLLRHVVPNSEKEIRFTRG